MPAKKRKQPDEKYPLKLTAKQRESLVHATRLTMGLKTRIKEASKDQQFVEFTKKELEKMGEEIYTSLAYVPPADRKRLNAALDKIDDLLDDLEGKHLTEKRQAVHKVWCHLSVQGHAQREPSADMASDSGAGLHAGRTSRSPSSRHGLGGLPSAPVHCPGRILWTPRSRRLALGHGKGGRGRDCRSAKSPRRDEGSGSFTSMTSGTPGSMRSSLRKLLEPEPNVAYPRCIEGARACPPEDVGGIWGYAEFLEAISDPKHESHEEMVEWIGGRFDPEKFSVDKVNRELRKG